MTQRLDHSDRVAQLRRPLEALLAGCLRHVARQAFHEFVVAAFEKQSCVLDGHGILLGCADFAHARRDASLDVVFEARPPAFTRDDLVARANAEQAVRQLHRPAAKLGGHERTRVVMVVFFDPPCDEHAGK
jgi:hypothetical protein